VSLLLASLTSLDPETRRLAVQRLQDEDVDGVGELLVRALGDEDWRVRKEAAQVARSAPRRAEVVSAVVAALDDHTNIGLRNAAVEALVLIGRDAIPAAVRALESLDADGRKLAVEVLGGVPDLEGTRALVRALDHDDDPNVRMTAAEALRNARLAGEDARALAIGGLKRALAPARGVTPAQRLSALEALIALEADLQWTEIAPLLEEPLLRRTAITTAARCKDDAAIVALLKLIATSTDGLARDAAVALAETALGDPPDPGVQRLVRDVLDTKAHAQLCRWLSEDGERVRGAALVLLGVVAQPSDAGLLARALGDPALEERAASALSLMGQAAALPLLLEARTLTHSAAAIAVSLASELIQETTPEHLARFRDALSHPAPDVVSAAIDALGAFGDEEDLARAESLAISDDARVASSARAALAALSSRLPREAVSRAEAIAPDSTRATAACVMLQGSASKLSPSPSVITYLKRALASGDARARRAAVEALATTSTAEAKVALALALADEEPTVQVAAIRALGALKHAAPIVTLLASAKDVEIVGAAYRALAAADPDQAVVEAKSALGRANLPAASVAVGAISSISGPQRDEVMLLALEHHDEEVVRAALSGLVAPLDARTIARLGLVLDHSSRGLRRATAELLGQDGSAAAEALLQARCERETDASVRDALLDAIRVSIRGEGTT